MVPSINFRCIDETLQQLLVRGGNSRLLPERQQTFRQLSVHPQVRPSTFRASEGPSVTFCASVQPSVNFRQLFLHSRDIPSSCINFPSGHGTYCQLLLTCLAFAGSSVSFHQFSVHLQDLPLTFHASTGFSVNFPCGCGSFHNLLSTFCAAKILSVNFPFS